MSQLSMADWSIEEADNPPRRRPYYKVEKWSKDSLTRQCLVRRLRRGRGVGSKYN
jgi:hypothetical protein